MFPIQHRPSESTGFSPLQSPLVSSRRRRRKRRIQERNFFNKIKISWYVQRQVEGIEFWSGRGKTGLDKSHFEIYHRGQQLSFWLRRGRCCGRSIFFLLPPSLLCIFSPATFLFSFPFFFFFLKNYRIINERFWSIFSRRKRRGAFLRFFDGYLDVSMNWITEIKFLRPIDARL